MCGHLLPESFVHDLFLNDMLLPKQCLWSLYSLEVTVVIWNYIIKFKLNHYNYMSSYFESPCNLAVVLKEVFEIPTLWVVIECTINLKNIIIYIFFFYLKGLESFFSLLQKTHT